MENIIIYMSDKRMEELSRFPFKPPKRPLYVYAPNVKVDEAELSKLPSNVDVVLGKIGDESEALARKRDIAIFNIQKDERFQAVNSRLTAEGALMLMLEKCPLALCDLRALVLGFGRLGAAIAKLFGDLGVNFDLVTSNLRPALAFSKNVVGYDADLSHYDVIVNTVPKPVISDSTLLTAKRGALYLDLASSPAVNLDYAKYLGLDADIYPALPAKVSPVSAAKAMFDYISEVVLC